MNEMKKMDSDYFLIGVVVAGFIYLIGEKIPAIYIGSFFAVLWIVSKFFEKKPTKAEKSNILPPIILKSKRNAPYRIPAKMKLEYKPDEYEDYPRWGSATGEGLIGGLAKNAGKGLRNLIHGKEKKKDDKK